MKKLFELVGKKKIYATGIVASIVACIVFAVYAIPQNPLALKQDTFVVEYGETISTKASDYLKTEDKKILDKAEVVIDKLENEEDKDYAKIGSYKTVIKYNKKSTEFSIEVKDTKAPEFKDIMKKIVLEQNAEDVDFTKFFEAEDLSDVEITVDSEKVDLEKVGDYEISVTATDEYKNADTKTVEVEVISLEDAEKEDATSKTLDGTDYQSKALKEKIVEEEQAQAKQEVVSGGSSNVNGNTNSSTGGSTQGGGSSNNGGGEVAQPYYRTDIANTYASQINAYRQQNGLSALPITGDAQAQANMRAMELVSSYGHDSSAWGENIGMGDAGYDFFVAWQNSPSHNGAMLEASMYDGMAVSVVEYNGKWYAVTIFHNKWS